MITTTNEDKVVFTPGTYNFLKKLVQVILPAVSALYFGLASIWHLPHADQVVGTIAVFTTFLGVCVGVSSSRYNSSDLPYDGTVNVIPTDEGGKVFSLELNGDPDELDSKKTLSFKVDTSHPEERVVKKPRRATKSPTKRPQ
jgi:hypothetical protein